MIKKQRSFRRVSRGTTIQCARLDISRILKTNVFDDDTLCKYEKILHNVCLFIHWSRSVNMPELTELDKAASSEPTNVELGIGSATDSDSDETIPDADRKAATAAAAAGAVNYPTGATTVTGLPLDMVSKAKQSRGEKKARKLMSKLGLKPVSELLNYKL